mgnify:CR=1 FL=1
MFMSKKESVSGVFKLNSSAFWDSCWIVFFVNAVVSTLAPWVGITTTDTTNSDVIYSLTGKNVDAVTIDTGVGILHPEFIADDGTYCVRDVLLDGPY